MHVQGEQHRIGTAAAAASSRAIREATNFSSGVNLAAAEPWDRAQRGGEATATKAQAQHRKRKRDPSEQGQLTSDERAELARLRKENLELRREKVFQAGGSAHLFSVLLDQPFCHLIYLFAIISPIFRIPFLLRLAAITCDRSNGRLQLAIGILSRGRDFPQLRSEKRLGLG